jgi:DNA transformation protein
MAVSKAYRDYVLEQLERTGPVTFKSMFGGAGLYADGLFFGLISGQEVFYLKVDDTTRPDYQDRDSQPFAPFGEKAMMNYFTVPEDVLEDPDELAVWARKAIAVAARTTKKKK